MTMTPEDQARIAEIRVSVACGLSHWDGETILRIVDEQAKEIERRETVARDYIFKLRDIMGLKVGDPFVESVQAMAKDAKLGIAVKRLGISLTEEGEASSDPTLAIERLEKDAALGAVVREPENWRLIQHALNGIGAMFVKMPAARNAVEQLRVALRAAKDGAA